MTTSRQFWTLFKLQPAINPTIFIMPLAFAFPLLMPSFARPYPEYHPSLSLLLTSQNCFYILIFVVLWLAPEMLGNGARWTVGTEFLITRAIDRTLLYRARLVAFFLAILVVPFGILLGSLGKSTIQISEYNRANQQAIISAFPGSHLVQKENDSKPTDILIPNGAGIIAAFNLWLLLLWAAGGQLFISAITSFKHKKIILWTFYMIIILNPLLFIFGSRSHTNSLDALSLNWTETLFLQFNHYQPIFWIATAIALVTIHLWCERRFARAEY